MTAVKEIKATLRPKAGKGAARAVRRDGRTPAVIYGAKEAPLAIAVDHRDIRTKIYAGHFLTTLYDIEIDGKKHRVIPRDYQLDPVKDFPIHVDFMRLSEGALIRVNVPLHVINTDQSPGVKRGGAVNIVPDVLADIYRSFVNGDHDRAIALAGTVANANAAARVGTFPAFMKAQYALKGLCDRYTAAPIPALTDAEMEQLRHQLTAVGVLRALAATAD